MRKLTIVIKPNPLIKKILTPVFKQIDSVEMKELLRLDFTEGKKIGVGDIVLKDGADISKLSVGKRMEILDVLKKNKNKYTCLVKVNVPKKNLKLFQFFNFDIIYDIPTTLTHNKLTYSVIGEEKNLKKFLTLMKAMGKIEKTIYKHADYRGIGIYKDLTEKQQHILQEAVRLGYYKYPREIETKELAQILGVSKTTLVEHLRKGENRILDKVFIGE